MLKGVRRRPPLIADRYCSRHADAMGRDPAERNAPDLFPTATASTSPIVNAATESLQ